MSAVQGKTLLFRVILFVFFLVPCLFSLFGAGEEATVARVLSLGLSLSLGMIYLFQDFLIALYSDTFKKAVPALHYLTSLAVIGVSGLGLGGMLLF